MTHGCEFHADALVELARGTLEPGREAPLRTHLETCEFCRADLRVAVTLLRHPVAVHDGLEASIRSAVAGAAAESPRSGAASAGARQPRSRVPRWAPIAGLLAAAAAFAMLWLGPPGMPGADADGEEAIAAVHAPYGAWPAADAVVAGDVVLSELSIEELERLLEEMGS